MKKYLIIVYKNALNRLFSPIESIIMNYNDSAKVCSAPRIPDHIHP